MIVPDSRRVLTVRQPWASLLMLPGEHRKDVENRSKPIPWTIKAEGRQSVLPSGTVRPFRLWIHAAARHDGNAFRAALLRVKTAVRGPGEPDNMMQWVGGWWANRDLPYGAVLGSVVVTDCHRDDNGANDPCSPWAERDAWHIVTADPEPLPEPIPLKGRLGWWRLPEGVPA